MMKRGRERGTAFIRKKEDGNRTGPGAKAAELRNRFNQEKPRMYAWYYSSIAEILAADPDLKDTQACMEYVRRVRATFEKYL